MRHVFSTVGDVLRLQASVHMLEGFRSYLKGEEGLHLWTPRTQEARASIRLRLTAASMRVV